MFSLRTKVADALGYVSKTGFGVGEVFLVGVWRGRESMCGCESDGAGDGDSGGGK